MTRCPISGTPIPRDRTLNGHAAISNDATLFYDDLRAHFDLSDELFELFLHPTRTDRCAYFELDHMTPEVAQARS